MERPAALDPGLWVYRGKSMSGTFEAGDLLEVEPVAMGELRLGDIVVFSLSHPRRGTYDLVHRIRAIQADGLVMRGDDNPADDVGLVKEHQLIGRVSSLARGNEARTVRGGYPGRLWALALRARRSAVSTTLRVAHGPLGMPYRYLRRTGRIRKIWKPRFERIRLELAGEVFITYRYRGREVARLHPRTGYLRCRKPFDLVLRHERVVAAPALEGAGEVCPVRHSSLDSQAPKGRNM